jgi:hypothetical protein
VCQVLRHEHCPSEKVLQSEMQQLCYGHCLY